MTPSTALEQLTIPRSQPQLLQRRFSCRPNTFAIPQNQPSRRKEKRRTTATATKSATAASTRTSSERHDDLVLRLVANWDKSERWKDFAIRPLVCAWLFDLYPGLVCLLLLFVGFGRPRSRMLNTFFLPCEILQRECPLKVRQELA